jgi:hypothetical protein
MSDGDSDSGRRSFNSARRRRDGASFVAGGLVILALLGAYVALDLSGHRIDVRHGTVEVGAKPR